MTVLDLILMADGLKKTGSFIAVDLYRQTLISDGNPYKSIDVDLQFNTQHMSDEDNPVLNENDLVIVRIKEGYAEPEFAEIQGSGEIPWFLFYLSTANTLFMIYLMTQVEFCRMDQKWFENQKAQRFQKSNFRGFRKHCLRLYWY